MDRIRPWAGIAGILLFLTGGLASLVARSFSVLWVAFMAMGVVLGVLHLVLNRNAVARPGAGTMMRRGANATASAALVVAIAVLLQAIASRHSKHWDLTEGGRFSLSPQSKKVAAELQQDVEAVAFYKETTANRQELEDLFKEYRHAGRRFSYRFVDPDRNPGEAKAHNVSNYGETILVSGAREERVYGSGERDVTNALIKVTREGKKKFYFLTGHGEHGLEDSGKEGLSFLKQGIESENFETAEFSLLRQSEVPPDAAVVVIAGPQSDLMPPEIESLRAYLEDGGKLFVMLEPVTAPAFRGAPALEGFLAEWGVKLAPDIIIDRMSRLFGGDYLIPIISQFETHPITKDFKVASFFPTARSVDVASPLPAGVNGQTLASAGADAWAEMDQARLANERQAQFDEETDRMGPVPVASVFTRSLAAAPPPDSAGDGDPADAEGTREARLVVFGDSDLSANANVGSSGNGNLLLNTLSWLAEEEDLVAIRPKEGKNEPVMLSAEQGRLLFMLPVIGIPLATLVIGTAVVARRRWRR